MIERVLKNVYTQECVAQNPSNMGIVFNEDNTVPLESVLESEEGFRHKEASPGIKDVKTGKLEGL